MVIKLVFMLLGLDFCLTTKCLSFRLARHTAKSIEYQVLSYQYPPSVFINNIRCQPSGPLVCSRTAQMKSLGYMMPSFFLFSFISCFVSFAKSAKGNHPGDLGVYSFIITPDLPFTQILSESFRFFPEF